MKNIVEQSKYGEIVDLQSKLDWEIEKIKTFIEKIIL